MNNKFNISGILLTEILEILDWNKVSDSKKNGYKGVNPMTHLNQKMKSKPIIDSPVASLGIHDHGFSIEIF